MQHIRILVGILVLVIVLAGTNTAAQENETEPISEEMLEMLKKSWLYEINGEEMHACIVRKKTKTLSGCFEKDPHLFLDRHPDRASTLKGEIAAVAVLRMETTSSELKKAPFVKISMTRDVPHAREINNYFLPKFENLRNTNVAGYFIDLRKNPGGYISGAAYFLKYFVPVSQTEEQLLFESRGRVSSNNYSFVATEPGIAANSCVAVLVDKNTASSAEIIAYVLQLWGAYVVGEPTYKKGIVQTTYPLSGGAEFTFTTGKIYYADGTTTDQRGVTPDLITNDAHTQWEQARAYVQKCYKEKFAAQQ